MQGLATDRVSLSFLVPRNQNPFLEKHLKPTRVCFSNLGSFPKSRISSQIVPLLANDFSSSSSFTHLFAHDRRLPRRLRASEDENSISTEAAANRLQNRLQNRLFMMYCYLGYMWMWKTECLPGYFKFFMTMGLLLDVSEFFSWININRWLRKYYMMLVMGFSCTHLLVDLLWWAFA